MQKNTGKYKQQSRTGKTEFVYYTFTPRPLTEGGFFELDDELTDFLSITYHTLGVLDGMVKYTPNRASFLDISLFMESCYSKLIDYQSPQFYNALKG